MDRWIDGCGVSRILDSSVRDRVKAGSRKRKEEGLGQGEKQDRAKMFYTINLEG